MTSSGNPQPGEMDSIVREAAVLDAPMPANETPANESFDPVKARVPAGRADELVDCHYEAVYRYAYRLCGCVATAEDVTQETFVQAIRYLDQLRASAAERGWLLAIARRQFMRVLRKVVHAKHGRMISIDGPTVNADTVLCVNEQIPHAIQAIEDRDQVEQALRELGQDARIIILMHYFEELSYAEIATQLEIPIGTVMSRLSRGREQLRKLLIAEDTRPEVAQLAAKPHSSTSSLAQPHLPTHHQSQEAGRD